MVRYGFSISELRQLYADEFYTYWENLIRLLEREGVIKSGTTDSMKGTDDVDKMRRQLKLLRRT